MQKISTYLYPNRIELLADLAGFTTEYTNVYQKNIKIYNGIDNVIQFDIKNADQKRLDLVTSPVISGISMNIMDASDKALPNSPYTVDPLSTTRASATGAVIVATTGKSTTTTITVLTSNVTGIFSSSSPLTLSSGISGPVTISNVVKDIDSATTTLTVTFLNQTVAASTGVTLASTTGPIKGIGTVTIPAGDLASLDSQFLKYSVTASDAVGNTITLYTDSRFSALGTIELVGNAIPVIRNDRVYNTFTAEIDLKGQPVSHSSAIPAKFYEAVPTETLDFAVSLTGFTGSIWVEATTQSTINTEAFKGSPYLDSYTFNDFTGTWNSTRVIGNYQYFRISYTTPNANGVGASFEVTNKNGSYSVSVRHGGTGYATSSRIKVLGSTVGGTDGVNDLIITATSIEGFSGYNVSSYAQGSILAIATSGTAANVTGYYIVTGTNITGTVDKVVVS